MSESRPALTSYRPILQLLEEGERQEARTQLEGRFGEGPNLSSATPGERLAFRLFLLVCGQPGGWAMDQLRRAGVPVETLDSHADPPETEVHAANTGIDHLLLGDQALREGRVADLIQAIDDAQTSVPRSMPWLRLRVGSLHQAAFRFSGDPAQHIATQGVCREVADRVDLPHLAVPARALLGNVHMLTGDFHACMDSCDAAIELASSTGLSEAAVTGMAHQFRGYVLFEWNRIEEAYRSLTTAWELTGPTDKGTRSGVARMMARLATQPQVDEDPGEWFRRLERIVAEPMTLRNREWLAAVRVRQAIGTGDLGAAQDWLRTYNYSAQGLRKLTSWDVRGRLQEMDNALAFLEVTERWAEVERLAPVILDAAQPLQIWFQARALTAQAVALRAQGKTKAADETFAKALSLGQHGGFVRLYVEGSPLRLVLLQSQAEDGRVRDLAARVLTAAESESLGNMSAAHPLSERQLDVLRRVAQGHSNKTIARDLTLSVSTVKTHLQVVFERLHVSSRTQAVAKARDLGVL